MSDDWQPGSSGSLELIPTIEGHLRVEVELFQKAEGEAAFRAIRIGVLVLKARQDLDHTQYLPWCQAHLPFGRVTVWRFLRVAEAFLQQKQISVDTAYAKIVPAQLQGQSETSEAATQAGDSVQLAFDFADGRSFSELCDALGMPVRARKAGDDIGGNAALREWLAKYCPRCKARKAADLPAKLRAKWEAYVAKRRAELLCDVAAVDRRAWRKALGKLYKLVETHVYRSLDRPDLEHAVGLLNDMRQRLLEDLRK